VKMRQLLKVMWKTNGIIGTAVLFFDVLAITHGHLQAVRIELLRQ